PRRRNAAPGRDRREWQMSAGGLSLSRLARMHDVLADYVERGEVPAIVSLVSRRGAVYVDAIGTKTAGGSDAVGRDAIFRISSMTKPITAAAAMILVEECKLRLDEPVDRLLPELGNRTVLRRLDSALDDTVPAVRPVTLRDLLTFRMGFGQLFAAPDAYPVLKAANELEIGMGPPRPQAMPVPDEWLRRLGTLPLMYQPGERWLYNTGSDVLGVLIARAAGQPFDAFLRRRLFDPLGMRDTGFSVPPEKQGRFSTSYLTDAQTGALVLFDDPATGQWSRPPAFPSGGAGLVSSVDDYFAFGDMLLHDGEHAGVRVLSKESVALMTRDQLTPEQKAASAFPGGFFDHHGWGFGVSVLTADDSTPRRIGTFGWDGGMGTGWYADPREDLTTILMTQAAWTSPIPPPVFRDFWRSAYEAIV